MRLAKIIHVIPRAAGVEREAILKVSRDFVGTCEVMWQEPPDYGACYRVLDAWCKLKLTEADVKINSVLSYMLSDNIPGSLQDCPKLSVYYIATDLSLSEWDRKLLT